MAYSTTSRPAPAGALWLFNPTHALGVLRDCFSAWRQEQDTVAILSKLSDHELDDIGIPRHAIEEFARR